MGRFRNHLPWLALAGLVSCGGDPTPPNLVVIVMDTLRPDHLGCYAYPRGTSPNLDRLAAESAVFDQAQSVSPWTAPALISLVSGLQPDVHGVRTFPFPARMVESAPTLGTVLSERGYRTGAFTEGGFAKGDFGLDRGFDDFPRHEGDDESHASNLHFPSRLEENARRALDWLDRNGQEPFFLLFHTYEPHAPYHPDDEDLVAVQPEYDPASEVAALQAAIGRWNAREALSDSDWRTIVRHRYHCALKEGGDVRRRKQLLVEMQASGWVPNGARAGETFEFVRDLYDAEIRYADAKIGELLDKLEQLGVMDNTVVMVVSDHGEAFGEHGQLGHGYDLHEEVLRIVWIARPAGGLAETRRIGEVVSSVDVLPTALDLLGVEASLDVQGSSREAWVRGSPEAGEPGVAIMGTTAHRTEPEKSRAVRTARWRWIERADGTGQLFDRSNDPGEVEDVASRHPDVVAELRQHLHDYRAQVADLRSRLGGETTPVAVDAQLQRELGALGYLGDDEVEDDE